MPDIYNPYAGVYKRAVELFENEEYPEAFSKFFAVVENDKANYLANYYLAECYFNGYGTEKNYERAFENYFIAASSHHLDSLYKVGLCYENGYGVEVEETQAVSWYMQATKSDHTEAQYHLGMCYYRGRGIEQNYYLAAGWFLKVARKNNVDGQVMAARCYEIINQPEAAATLSLAAAEHGSDEGCYKIGRFYDLGYGCPKNAKVATYFLTKCANMKKSNNIERINSAVFDKDEYKDAKTYNVAAMLCLAGRYKRGEVVKKSFKDAIFWWLKASERSSAAQIELAKCYYNGEGVMQDYSQALKWLTKAANMDNVEAMMWLAEFNLNPPAGQDGNPINAKVWWSKAAALGDSLAMYKLGLCYEDCIGVNYPNYSEAYRWYHLASTNGNEDATEACKRFKKSLFGRVKIKGKRKQINKANQDLNS